MLTFLDPFKPLAAPLGRILLAIIFVAGGIQKIGGYAGTAGYMEAYGVPGILLPLVILLELGGGLMVLAGFWSRPAALAIAVFTIVAALIFHTDFSNEIQIAMFLKNLAISGGLLMVFAFGPGRFAVNDK